MGDKRNARLWPLAVWAGFGVLYASFRTREYYWDGIGFAQSIEDASGLTVLLHPNHLLYTVLGASLHSLTGPLFGFRAIDTLQFANCIVAAAAVVMVGRWLLEISRSMYFTAAFTVLFGCAATWWRFASDSNAYVPAVTLLLLAFGLAGAGTRHSNPTMAGLTHAGAMLCHQLAVFAFLPLAIQVWQKSRAPVKALTRYAVTASTVTLAAYVWGWRATFGKTHEQSFLAWMTRTSPDAAFSSDWIGNAFLSARGEVRLFFGGRAPDSPGFAELLLLLALTSAVTFFLVSLIRSRRALFSEIRALPEALARHQSAVCLSWIAVYVAFLFVWLPHNTFYRLFYLPPMVWLGAGLVSTVRTERGRHRLALFTLVLVLWNFQFVVLPASRGTNDRERSVTEAGQALWDPGTRIYYDTFPAENWTVRYFNPQTEWVPIGASGWEQLQSEITARAEGAPSIWIDHTARTRVLEEEEGETPAAQNLRDPEESRVIRGLEGELRFVRLGRQ